MLLSQNVLSILKSSIPIVNVLQKDNQVINLYKPEFKYSTSNQISKRPLIEKYSVQTQRIQPKFSQIKPENLTNQRFTDIYHQPQRKRTFEKSEIYEEREIQEDQRSVGGISYKSITEINGIKVRIRERSCSTTKNNFKPYNEKKEHEILDHLLSQKLVSSEYNIQAQPKKTPLFDDYIIKAPKEVKKGTFIELKQDEDEEEIEDDEDFKEVYFDSGRYEGQVYNGVMNGQGVLYNEDGEVVYEGGFKEGEFDGHGVLINNDQGGKEHDENYLDLGQAKECWEKFEGLFEDSQRNGVGYLYFNNGDVFLGEFKRDKANGLGIYSCKDQKIFGVWENDAFKKSLC